MSERMNSETNVLHRIDELSEAAVQFELSIDQKKQALFDAFNELVNAFSAKTGIDGQVEELKKSAEAFGVDRGLVTTMIEGRTKILKNLAGHAEFTPKEGRGRPTIGEKAVKDAFTAAEAVARGSSVKAVADQAEKKAVVTAEAVASDLSDETAAKQEATPESNSNPEESADQPAADAKTEASATALPEEHEHLQQADAADDIISTDQLPDDEGNSRLNDGGDAIETAFDGIDASVFGGDDIDIDAEQGFASEGLDPLALAEIDQALNDDLDGSTAYLDRDSSVEDGAFEGPSTIEDDPVAAAAANASAAISGLHTDERIAAYGTDLSM